MYINRTAVVIKAKQPLVNWINSTPKAKEENRQGFTLAEINEDCEVLLLPDYDTLNEVLEELRPLKTEIFEDALDEWESNEKLWPQNRSEEMFDVWFGFEIHSMVDDTVDEPIVRDDSE
jgi:hypothetical protein